MIVAWAHPQIEATWKRIDDLPLARRTLVRSGVVAACTAAGYVWYTAIYTLPKVEYNAVHPYTSWVPLTLWIVVRNLTPAMRSHSLGLFGWLGCVTLETYIGQFHIWLRSNIPDGQPKWILDVVRACYCCRPCRASDSLRCGVCSKSRSWRLRQICCEALKTVHDNNM